LQLGADPPDSGYAYLSAECVDFMQRIFVMDPAARLKPREMLRHPWLAEDF